MRSNKCEYCSFDINGYGRPWNDQWGGAKTYILANNSNGEYYLVTADGKMSAPINNCPKCGRPLAKGLLNYVPSNLTM